MKRIIPGLLIAGFWLLLLLKGPVLLFSIVMILVVLAGSDEYVKMVSGGTEKGVERLFLDFIVALPVVGICIFPNISVLPLFILISFFGLTGYFFIKYKFFEDNYHRFCRLVFGLIFIGLLGAHFILLRHLPEGGTWLIVVSAITACSDSGAYFVGRAFGKHKLCPSISPNKTIEGAVGGIGAGLLGAAFFAFLLLPVVHWPFLLFSAVLLGGVGIAGDLTESIVKRGTGTKDSGTCLAGHGGILDRVDSLLFAVPVLYYLIIFSGI
ncbi:MAG: phosphatidate cytidylyltransferase [Desulfobulbaceae bacterium]|nr:phosphatidate cytidylyltransferase [Desulfobulbaceae bacterium]